MPPDAPYLPGGMGNDVTCTTQAFFGQAVVGTVTYNTVLAVQYVLIIKLKLSETIIAERYEKYMHGVPILVWLITGCLGIGFEVFNPAFFNCWITPVPINCAAYGENPEGRPDCTRGYLAPIFQWAIFYGLIWGMIVIVTVLMLIVYCEVRKTDLKSMESQQQQNQQSGSTEDTESQCKLAGAGTPQATATITTTKKAERAERMQRSKKVAKQGLWYLFPFYATWFFPVITEITEMVTNQYYDPMVVLVSFFVPFQGALNFIIYYMRPRYIKFREQNPNVDLISALSFSFHHRSSRRSGCESDIFCSRECTSISIANHGRNRKELDRLSSEARLMVSDVPKDVDDFQDNSKKRRQSSLTLSGYGEGSNDNDDEEEEKVEEEYEFEKKPKQGSRKDNKPQQGRKAKAKQLQSKEKPKLWKKRVSFQDDMPGKNKIKINNKQVWKFNFRAESVCSIP